MRFVFALPSNSSSLTDKPLACLIAKDEVISAVRDALPPEWESQINNATRFVLAIEYQSDGFVPTKEDKQLISQSESHISISSDFLDDISELPGVVENAIREVLGDTGDPTFRSQTAEKYRSEQVDGKITEQARHNLFTLACIDLGDAMYNADRSDEPDGYTWDHKEYRDHLSALQNTEKSRKESNAFLDQPADQIQFASSILAARLTNFMVQLKWKSNYAQVLGHDLQNKHSMPLPSSLPLEIGWVRGNPLSWGELFGLVWLLVRRFGPMAKVDVEGIQVQNHREVRMLVSDPKYTNLSPEDWKDTLDKVQGALNDKRSKVEVGITHDRNAIFVTLKQSA